MKTMKIGDRIFKECEDVPLAVAEKRKLFQPRDDEIIELCCVSTQMGLNKDLLFLYTRRDGLQYDYKHYRRPDHSKYNSKVYIDVTPEKRYAIWNSKAGRFIVTDGFGLRIGAYTSREEAEKDIRQFQARYPNTTTNNLKVVEFDNPDAEE